MNLAAEILVIILSVTLTIFLIFSIILIGYLIKLTRQIRRVTNAAEKTVDHIESAVSQAAKMSLPMYFSEFVSKLVNKFKKDEEEKK